MSAVDVLAVMADDALFANRRRRQTIPELADGPEALSGAARAAVKELIEADREYDQAKAEHDDLSKFDEIGMYVPRAVYERMEAATVRRAAALARVGGAA